MFKRRSPDRSPGSRTPDTANPALEGQARGPENESSPRAGGESEGPAPRYVARRAGESANAAGSPAPRRSDYRPPSTPAGIPAASTPSSPGSSLAAPAGETEGRKLVVGREIRLAGEIKKCEKLVVEGEVEANLTDCLSLEIAESGFFNGAAVVEEAEISGVFEGDLTARTRLYLRATGRIIGTVRYAELEIERGGKIAGSIDVLDPEASQTRKSQPAAKSAQSPAQSPAQPSGSQAGVKPEAQTSQPARSNGADKPAEQAEAGKNPTLSL